MAGTNENRIYSATYSGVSVSALGVACFHVSSSLTLVSDALTNRFRCMSLNSMAIVLCDGSRMSGLMPHIFLKQLDLTSLQERESLSERSKKEFMRKSRVDMANTRVKIPNRIELDSGFLS
jgi:hypothetical protein